MVLGKWFQRADVPVDVVYPVPGRRRYADVPVCPPDRRPVTRTDRAERRGGNAGRHFLP